MSSSLVVVNRVLLGQRVIGLESWSIDKAEVVEIINDLDPELYNFFSVLQDRRLGAELVDRILELRHCERSFNVARAAREQRFSGQSDVGKALCTFILVSQSFNATRQSYQRGILNRDYRALNQKHIPPIYERMADIRVKNTHATKILDKVHDNPAAFVFSDLPYLHTLRSKGACDVYGHEMSQREHLDFLETARHAKCAIMICGYRNENGHDLYDQILLGQGNSNWRHYLLTELPKTCIAKGAKGLGREWIWCNYELPAYAGYYIQMDSANW